MGNTWGDVSFNNDPSSGMQSGRDPHEESFEYPEQYVVNFWMPPPRDASGHRVAINDHFRPVPTRYMNWRWWLAEIPMRILARHAIKQQKDRDRQGEEFIGSHHQGHQQYDEELGPE